MNRNLSDLEARLGYGFKNKALLRTALTHSSYAHENGSADFYERLEFLGDSILGFVAAREIFRLHPSMPEGEMSRNRAEAVCEAGLYPVALRLGLSEFLLLGKNEECGGGREKISILADCVESIIAAIYLDAGLEAAQKFTCEKVLPELCAGQLIARHDYKSVLQEHTQKLSPVVPQYTIVRETGPDHDKRFYARVTLPDGAFFEGEGRSKKEAEQEAARRAIGQLRIS